MLTIRSQTKHSKSYCDLGVGIHVHVDLHVHVHVHLHVYLPGLGLLMTLKGGEFGVGLLPLLEEVDSTPLVLLCPVLVGLFPCWRALCKEICGVESITFL